MTAIIVFLFGVAALGIVLFAQQERRREREEDLERQIGYLTENLHDQRTQLEVLRSQVAELQARTVVRAEEPPPIVVPVPAVVVAAPEPPPSLPVAEEPPPPLPKPEPPALEPEPEPEPVVVPGPTWGERFRAEHQGEEWEAIVGGSLLNKLGALMLVIGVALFLGYTMTHLGAAGKVALGWGISLGLIAAGVLLERQARYKVFARGFLGAGWSLLYFTAYAMYGLPAAQVVTSPAAGFVLLLLVAAGMVLHSLRYRSEVLTGLTFFIAFTTLTLFPPSSYALVASLLLAAFLLVVAERLGWTTVVVAGLIFTYGTHALQYEARDEPRPDAWIAQGALWVYWLLFEAFDLIRLRRDGPDRGILRTILPLNACGFIGLAVLPGSPVTSDHLALFLGAASVALMISAFLRSGSLRQAESDTSETFFEALLSGGFESAITLSAVAAIAAFSRRFSGTALKLALLMEGEFLVLSGLLLGRRYLRQLGAITLSLGFIKIFTIDIYGSVTRLVLGRVIASWTPSALMTAAVYYLNRAITRATPLYTWGGAALLTAVIVREYPWEYVGFGVFLLGLAVLAAGYFAKWSETNWQALILVPAGFLGVCAMIFLYDKGAPTFWIGLLTGVLLILLTGVLYRRELLTVAQLSSAGVVSLALLWLARELPLRGVVLGYVVVAIVVVEVGRRLPWVWLRLLGGGAYLATVIAGFYSLSLDRETWYGLPHWIVAVGPAALAGYYLTERTRTLDGLWARGFQFLGTALTVAVLGRYAGEDRAGVAWAVFSIVLLVAGLLRNDLYLRLQAYLVALFSYLAALTILNQEHERIWRAAVVIALLYVSQALLTRFREAEQEAVMRWVYSIAASLLLCILLTVEISGERLTVAWGIEGISLLIAGFVTRERVLRLSGLALFLVCVLKLFLYDLRNLDTLNRILSFIVLGLFLIGASWVYTRFRDQMRKLL